MSAPGTSDDGRHAGGPLTIQVETHRPVPVLRLSGEFDIVSAPEFRTTFAEALTDARSVVVDLTGLGFIDSSGLGSLVAGHKKVRARGGVLACVCATDGATASLIRLTGLNHVLALATTVDEAVEKAAGLDA